MELMRACENHLVLIVYTLQTTRASIYASTPSLQVTHPKTTHLS